MRVSWTVDARMVQRVGARTRHERHGVYVLRVSDRRMDDLGTLWEGDAREDVTRAWAALGVAVGVLIQLTEVGHLEYGLCAHLLAPFRTDRTVDACHLLPPWAVGIPRVLRSSAMVLRLRPRSRQERTSSRTSAGRA